MKCATIFEYRRTCSSVLARSNRAEEEILQYYRDHPASFLVNGTVRSFDDAHDVARAALIAERRGEIDS